MKKLLLPLLTALLCLCIACAEESPLPTFSWERDGENHWQLDENGAIITQGAHDAGDDWMCSICNCEILDWGEGAIDVSDYDEYGNLLRYTSFENGEKTYESIHMLTCNEDGLILTDKEYVNGVLSCESTYTVSAEGDHIPVAQTTWNDDGTTSVNKYDEHGNCIYAVVYSEDGAVIFETISEFALNDDGYYYECKTTSRFDSGETFYKETNQHSDTVRTLNTYADGTVWADEVYEYEYKDFTMTWSKQFSFGKLVWEEHFDAEGNAVQGIEYLEDGSQVVYLYNDQADMASATTYTADGSILCTKTYEYVYSEDMEILEVREYTDKVLTMETIYLYDEEYGCSGSTETLYNADGTRTVNVYDEMLDLISTVVYAADGSTSTDAAGEDR